MNDNAVARLAFYNTGLAKPYVMFDGANVAWQQNPDKYDSTYTEYLRIARSVAPSFNLETDSVFSDSVDAGFRLWIVPTDTITGVDIRAFVVILEDSLPGNYTVHMNVCRALTQFPVNLMYGDTLDTNIVFRHSIRSGRLKAAVFVQDMAIKEVLQARMIRF